MAGIGFELQKLQLEGNLSSHFKAIGHAAVIAAGPWLITIMAIATITVLTENIAGLEVLTQFRVIIIYAFAFSLISTSAVVIVASRQLSDAIYSKNFSAISALFLASLFSGAILTTVFTLFIYLTFFSLPLDQMISGTVTCTLVGLIWIALAFCSAVRDYKGITRAFFWGLSSTIITSIIVTLLNLGVVGFLWAFNSGLIITFLKLTNRVLITFPQPVHNFFGALKTFIFAFKKYWLMELAATLSVLAIWVDKFIMWFGPTSEAIPGGLRHAPLYDSAMFIAYLVIIPSLAYFILHMETSFFKSYQRYYADIMAHAPLSQIDRNAKNLEKVTFSSLKHIGLIQAALVIIILFSAPVIIEALNMQFRQAGVLRLGAIGAMFQFIFLACSSLLLFFSRYKNFFYLQLTFFVLNAGITYFMLGWGEYYYGLGYLLASLISSMVALITLENTLKRLNYLTFINATGST